MHCWPRSAGPTRDAHRDRRCPPRHVPILAPKTPPPTPPPPPPCWRFEPSAGSAAPAPSPSSAHPAPSIPRSRRCPQPASLFHPAPRSLPPPASRRRGSCHGLDRRDHQQQRDPPPARCRTAPPPRRVRRPRPPLVCFISASVAPPTRTRPRPGSLGPLAELFSLSYADSCGPSACDLLDALLDAGLRPCRDEPSSIPPPPPPPKKKKTPPPPPPPPPPPKKKNPPPSHLHVGRFAHCFSSTSPA